MKLPAVPALSVYPPGLEYVLMAKDVDQAPKGFWRFSNQLGTGK